MSEIDALPRLGQGFYWQELFVGQKFRTFRRTVTEADLIGFIGTTGMLEAIFIDTDFDGAMVGRAIPAALTQAIIEGFLMQTMLQGTGMALLEVSTKILSPVCVGDAIWATVEVMQIRPTSKSGRAVVDSHIVVFNHRNESVLKYDVKRLLAGTPKVAAVMSA